MVLVPCPGSGHAVGSPTRAAGLPDITNILIGARKPHTLPRQTALYKRQSRRTRPRSRKNPKLRNNLRQRQLAQPLDNLVALSSLGTLDREMLKDSLAIIKRLRQVLGLQFKMDR